MDLATLARLFGATLSPDPNVRKAAELDVRRLKTELDYLVPALLQIIGAPNDVDGPTRQATAIFLKNLVFSSFPPQSSNPIPPAARDTLKASLLPLLAAVHAEGVIREQVAHTFYNVVSHDNYPSLVGELTALVNSSNVGERKAGVRALLEAVRAVRYHPDKKPLYTLIDATFPRLVQIAGQGEMGDAETLHWILKTYHASTAMTLSPHQRAKESLVPWGQLLFNVVRLNVPAGEGEGSELWKAKKWAYGVLGRLFQRYGNPSQLPAAYKKEYAEFADHFVKAFAPEILSVYLGQVELYIRGEAWMSDKCQYHVFTFFNECIKPSSTWNLLKPHFPLLISSFLFPLLVLTPARLEQFNDDPVEYIRVTLDDYDNYQTPVGAGTTFLLGLVRSRTKSCFEQIVSWVSGVLNEGIEEKRYGALTLLGAISPWMMRHTAAASSVGVHVLSALQSPHPPIRSVACDLLHSLIKSKLPFSAPAMEALYTLLDDPALPVRVNAVLALTAGVERYDEVKQGIRDRVGRVVADVLKMSQETDLDVLNHSMEVLVDTYQDEMMPFAANLASTLCENYMRIVREIVASDQDTGDDMTITTGSVEEEDKSFHAMGLAKTIWTVITAVESSPPVLAEVTDIIAPIITFTVSHSILDLLDSVYDLADSVTFKLRSIPSSLQPIFPASHALFKGEGVDYLEEMLPTLDNFVSFGSHLFMEKPEWREMLADFYVESQTNAHLGEGERVEGCKLAEAMFINLRGGVDAALPVVIQATIPQDKAETHALRLASLQVIINAILYNPALTLSVLGADAGTFLTRWMASVEATYTSNGKYTGTPLFKRVHDKRLSILALCALLDMDMGSVPEALRAGWGELVIAVLKLFKDYAKAIENRKLLESQIDETADLLDDLDDEEVEMSTTNDDEDVWDEDSAYLEMLAGEGARLQSLSQAKSTGEFEDQDVDEVSDEEEEEEELGFFTPLDNVNPYTAFRDVAQRKGINMEGLNLNAELQGVLVEVGRIAETAT